MGNGILIVFAKFLVHATEGIFWGNSLYIIDTNDTML
jgi:archaeosine-15-forming tRNA-guanine transglycosylase